MDSEPSFFFFQAEDGIRDYKVTGVQTCALPISGRDAGAGRAERQPCAGAGRSRLCDGIRPDHHDRARPDPAQRSARAGRLPGRVTTGVAACAEVAGMSRATDGIWQKYDDLMKIRSEEHTSEL